MTHEVTHSLLLNQKLKITSHSKEYTGALHSAGKVMMSIGFPGKSMKVELTNKSTEHNEYNLAHTAMQIQ